MNGSTLAAEEQKGALTWALRRSGVVLEAYVNGEPALVHELASKPLRMWGNRGVSSDPSSMTGRCVRRTSGRGWTDVMSRTSCPHVLGTSFDLDPAEVAFWAGEPPRARYGPYRTPSPRPPELQRPSGRV